MIEASSVSMYSNLNALFVKHRLPDRQVPTTVPFRPLLLLPDFLLDHAQGRRTLAGPGGNERNAATNKQRNMTLGWCDLIYLTVANPAPHKMARWLHLLSPLKIKARLGGAWTFTCPISDKSD